MIGIELISDTKKTPAAAQAKEVRRLCREAGVLIGVGGTLANVLRVQPPLCMNEAEADRACEAIEKAIDSL